MHHHLVRYSLLILVFFTGACTEEEESVNPTTPTQTEIPAPETNEETKKTAENSESTKPRPGSVTLPLRPTETPASTFDAGCKNDDNPSAQPITELSFIDGRTMSQKSDTLFKPPWEVEFGNTYVGPQGMLAPGDGKLYVCSGVDEMVILDVSDPQNLKPFARLRPSTELEVLEPREGMAVLHHLAIEDMPNVWGRCEHIKKRDDMLYFSHRGDYFRPNGYVIAYDMSAEKPVQRGIYVNKERSFEGFAVNNDLLYVTQHGDGLAILRHEGEGFALLSEISGMTNAWDVAVHNSHAFVADGPDGMVVINIRNPRKPRKVTRIPIEGVTKSIVLSPDGKTAYVAAGAYGLAVVDISTPAKPQLISQLETPGTASNLSLSGTLLSLADWNEARVYSITEPQQPRLISSKKIKNERPVSRTVSVTMENDILFVGEWFGVYSFRTHAERKAPDIDIHHQWFDLGTADSSNPSSSAMRIRNIGNAPLEVSSLSSSLTSVVVSPTMFQVAPGGEQIIELVFSPNEPELHQGVLALCSNDPDEAVTRVRIRGNAGARAIGQSPPEVQLRLLDGTPWSLKAQKGHPVLLAYFATF